MGVFLLQKKKKRVCAAVRNSTLRFPSSLYDRAVVSAGLEFRSDKLWDHYIQWETSRKRVVEAFGVFKRLIAVPTQLYSANFEKYVGGYESLLVGRKKKQRGYGQTDGPTDSHGTVLEKFCPMFEFPFPTEKKSPILIEVSPSSMHGF